MEVKRSGRQSETSNKNILRNWDTIGTRGVGIRSAPGAAGPPSTSGAAALYKNYINDIEGYGLFFYRILAVLRVDPYV